MENRGVSLTPLIPAASFSGGIAAAIRLGAHEASGASMATLLALTALALAIGAIRAKSASALRRAAGLTACGFFAGLAWGITHTQMPTGRHVRAVAPKEGIVRFEGAVEDGPRRHVPANSPFSYFETRAARWSFEIRAERCNDAECEGSVLIWCDEDPGPLRPGDLVRVTGTVRAPQSPRNPGDMPLLPVDARQVVADVPQRALIEVERLSWLASGAIVSRLKQVIHDDAHRVLQDALSDRLNDAHRAIAAELLLGRSDGSGDSLMWKFRQIGLAHVLAISGMHLSLVLSGIISTMARLQVPGRIRAVAIVILVCFYLLLVDLRVPVVRAGFLSVGLAIGAMFGRRWNPAALSILSLIPLLVLHPSDVVRPAFQLSFAAVLAILILAPRLQDRWMPEVRAARDAGVRVHLPWQRLRSALIISITAWAVTAPITLHHFGTLAPLGPALSILVTPIIAVVLACGYLMLLTGGADWPAYLVAKSVSLLCDIAQSVAASPVAEYGGPKPPLLLTGALTIFIIAWAAGLFARHARRAALGLASLISAILVIAHVERDIGALRLDMLSVGSGTCILIRSGHGTILYDAGSTADLAIGRRRLVPALRALGVQQIDQAIISHANLDHFVALPEIHDGIGIDSYAVAPQFLRRAELDGSGAAATLLREMFVRGVSRVDLARGDVIELAGARIRVVHPSASDAFEAVNDESISLLIDCAGRGVLLCGDIQAPGMAGVQAHVGSAPVDLLELPHHGSFHLGAVAFVRAVNPSVVIQSTGPRRLDPDRWAEERPLEHRLITWIDGAITVRVGGEGRMTAAGLRGRSVFVER